VPVGAGDLVLSSHDGVSVEDGRAELPAESVLVLRDL